MRLGLRLGLRLRLGLGLGLGLEIGGAGAGGRGGVGLRLGLGRRLGMGRAAASVLDAATATVTRLGSKRLDVPPQPQVCARDECEHGGRHRVVDEVPG